MQTLSSLTIRETRPEDRAAVVRARARSAAPSERSAEECPAGRRGFFAEDDEGYVVAHVAGIPRRVRVGDQDVVWTEVVDAFARPAEHAGLGKRTPFLQVAKAFSAHYGGNGEDRDAVLFGVPSAELHRLAKERLGAEVVRNQNLLRARVEQLEAEACTDCTVSECAEFPGDTDALFERAAANFGALAVRDRSFLEWRFTRRPGSTYRIAVARRGEALVGYAVTRARQRAGESAALVSDWLVEPGDQEAGRALRAWLVRSAIDAGSRELLALFPEPSGEFVAFQQAGYRVHPTRSFLVARSFQRRCDMLWLYRNWYYTFADFADDGESAGLEED